MIKVKPIEKGIVIDHIQPGQGLFIYHYLELADKDFTSVLLTNVPSSTYGKKDMIKIAGPVNLDLNALGFIDPTIRVNYIEHGEVVEKVNLSLPKELDRVVSCKNPRCITSEEEVESVLTLIDDEENIYSCVYCHEMYPWEDREELLREELQ